MPRLITVIAAPLSLLYKSLAWLQRTWRARHPRAPEGMFVISVDGIAFGGTGKTPMSIRVGKELRQLGIPFAVITRGYGSRLEKTGARVEPGIHGAADVGDEALIIQRNLPGTPIWIGRDRRASLREAARAGLHVAVLDDGFQSTHIPRHVKIMMFNPDQPWTWLRHFPRLMREADLLLTFSPARRSCRLQSHGTYSFQHEGFFNARGKRVDVKDLPLFGFSALGDNRRFREDLSRFQLAGFKAFPDHHAFSSRDMRELERRRGETDARFLVCTEKDFVKAVHATCVELPLIYAANGVQLDFDLRQYLRHHVPGQNEAHT